jgi:hypothetical protein
MRSLASDYESLLAGFNRFRNAAVALDSPNPEDDDFVRMAIVGFSLNAPTAAWSRQHLDYVRSAHQADFSDNQLEFLHGVQAHSYALFAGLSLGYLLGLRESGRLSDDELTVGEAQLPGFMAGAVGSIP